MYHELTRTQIARRRTRRIIGLVVILLCAIAIALGLHALQANARDQGALSLRESILSSARQCCAVEGSYPSTLSHLEDVYGLTVNHDDYIISYEWFADNVLPSVVVEPR